MADEIAPGMTVKINPEVGNTDYDLVKWGGLEARVVSTDGRTVTVEGEHMGQIKTQEFHEMELTPVLPVYEHECQWRDVHSYVVWSSDSTTNETEPPSGLPVNVLQRCPLCWRERTITRGVADGQ